MTKQIQMFKTNRIDILYLSLILLQILKKIKR
nr:MAG TPA: hypothetical protein [Caudoviricetes sp.]